MSSPNGGVMVLISIQAEPGYESEARRRLSDAIQTSRKPGMISSREYADPASPGAFYAMQEWESAAAFEAHMRDAAEHGMSEAVDVLREPPRTVVLRPI